jgi:sec-independent protein translocase protein TatA
VQTQRHAYLTPISGKRLRLRSGVPPASGIPEADMSYNRATVAQRRSQLQGALMFSLFGPIGLPEMLIILAIVILIFGANRLPELGKGIGAGIKNFKSSMKETEEEK